MHMTAINNRSAKIAKMCLFVVLSRRDFLIGAALKGRKSYGLASTSRSKKEKKKRKKKKEKRKKKCGINLAFIKSFVSCPV